MKVIDVLNKIANGEPVKKFKYNGVTYCYTGFEKDLYRSEINEYDFDIDINSFCLNSQVEMIEEDKKIEKIKWNEKSSYNQEVDTKKLQKILLSRTEQLKQGINEIIDYLNNKEN